MRALLILCLTLSFVPPAAAQGRVENVSVTATAAVNALRARHGLPPLRSEARLTRAAAGHATDMSRKGFFSHTGSDGSSVGKRARRHAYGPCVIAENIAKGHPRMEQVLRAWMGSRGHRRNILNADVTEFALVRGSGNIWVMILGRPGC
ncbi:CAP domain-containing protein [Roseovarius sp. CAU 1744]|uniref:CAP domain-containing protein n=1 Tax=Roseovarius sp. CAU 1744 TaxID=3140368 RepID=UPI00325A4D9F